MEWCKLDIRKASVLKKEVDLALLSLQQAEGDDKRRAALLGAFRERIDDLEEFRSQYDSDERSILFEKERLRLRKVVQDSISTTPAVLPTSSSASKSKPSGLTGVVKHIAFHKTPSRKSREAEAEAAVAAAAALSPSTKGKTPAKIYDWEDEGKSSGVSRGMISVDGNIFAPCNEPGIYVAAREELDPNCQEEFIDVQIVLSKEEMSLLASRMIKTSDPQNSHFKNQVSSGSVFHQTPYVDQSKLLKDLYRPTNPGKWTSSGDLRPNAKR